MISNVIENSEITSLRSTGRYSDYKDPAEIKCPICGNTSAKFYKNTETREVVGCSECIETIWWDEYDENELL